MAKVEADDLVGLDASAAWTDPKRAAVLRKAFGLRPLVCLLLTVDPSVFDPGDGYAGTISVVRVAVHLLRAGSGDGVLLKDGREPLLLRRGGRVVLSDSGWWKPDMRAMVSLPHEDAPLPRL
ncbi:MAG: hypothetical protein HY928_07080 [Elusimicrobia bacterium]|nr:hypothetical protein [Elusimicrobiota bacterium]